MQIKLSFSNLFHLKHTTKKKQQTKEQLQRGKRKKVSILYNIILDLDQLFPNDLIFERASIRIIIKTIKLPSQQKNDSLMQIERNFESGR